MTAKSNREKQRIRNKQAKEAAKVRKVQDPGKPVKILDKKGNVIKVLPL